MKKFYTILTLFIMLSLLICYKTSPQKSCEVLKVLEGDKVVLDLNHNKKQDEDEVFHLYNINTLPLRHNQKSAQYVKDLNISPQDGIVLGYLAKKYTNSLLLNKNIVITSKIEEHNPNYGYRFAKITYQGKDVAQILLEESLAFAYKTKEYNEYLQFENKKKMKNVLKNAQKLEIMMLDKKTKFYHKPNCKNAIYIKNINLEIKPLKDISKEFSPCKKCFLTLKKTELNSEEILKIEPPTPNVRSGDISLFLIDPNKYSRPSKACRTSACQALLKNINEAKTNIDFALYGLDSQDDIYNALLNAKKRGVIVRGVVDSKVDKTFVYKDTQKLQKAFLLASDNTNYFMHNKFFVFDKKKVFTGSMNISNTGSGGYNSNTVLIIDSPFVAEIYLSEIEQMLGGKFQKAKLDKSVEDILLPSGTKLSVYFSPKSNPYVQGIKPYIDGAKKEIYISIFYLTYREMIADLKAAKERGVDVKIIVDATSAFSKSSKIAELRSYNIPVKVENWGGKSHEKNIVIDGKILVSGSSNFSFSGFTKNDENVVILQNASLSQYYRKHFLKLYASVDNKYLEKNPQAESFASKNSCFDGVDNDHDGKIDSKDEGCFIKHRVIATPS